MGQLLNELKRRNVFRVAIAYAVAAWALLQIADLVLDNIGAPGWVMQAFMLATALGFPFVLMFSWAFELTPDGLKREKDADPAVSQTHVTARKLDRITIALLLVVLIVFAGEQFLGDSNDRALVAETTSTDKSIAVLAFEDLSPAGDQAYVEVRQQLDAQTRNGADNLFYWLNEAEYAALTGNRDATLAHLQSAMDAGLISVLGFLSPAFERWSDDAGFIELESESIRRANAARRKLGMLAI
ncbi:MAG: hypothetical protein WD078_10030 [Woeseia sp.]